jgi:hypothetical protein
MDKCRTDAWSFYIFDVPQALVPSAQMWHSLQAVEHKAAQNVAQPSDGGIHTFSL